MKFFCSRDELIEAISYTQKAVSNRTTMPVLEGILFEAKDNTLKLTGYDLEIGIEAEVQADIIEGGLIVINSKTIGDIIRKLPDNQIELSTADRLTVIIRSGRSEFQVKGLDPENYPRLPEVEATQSLTIPQKMLREMIHQTLFAASTDESRPNLNGSLLVSEADRLEMVAIDGFRMALRRMERDPEEEDQKEPWPQQKFVISGKAQRELQSILTDRGTVTLYTTDNHVLFTVDDVRLTSRLITGEYMNYQSIIPTNELTRMVVDTDELRSAFERTLLLTSTEQNRFPVSMTTPDTETLNIDIASVRGTMHEEVHVSTEGKMIDCDFNPRFVLDALRVIDDERIAISFKGDIGPAVIRPEEGEKFAFIVLPLRK